MHTVNYLFKRVNGVLLFFLSGFYRHTTAHSKTGRNISKKKWRVMERLYWIIKKINKLKGCRCLNATLVCMRQFLWKLQLLNLSNLKHFIKRRGSSIRTYMTWVKALNYRCIIRWNITPQQWWINGSLLTFPPHFASKSRSVISAAHRDLNVIFVET